MLAIPTTFKVSIFLEEEPLEALFPVDNALKTTYAMRTMLEILQQQSNYGVADGNFISRAIRLLIKIILQEGRSLDAHIIHAITLTLVHFFNGGHLHVSSAIRYPELTSSQNDRLRTFPRHTFKTLRH